MLLASTSSNSWSFPDEKARKSRHQFNFIIKWLLNPIRLLLRTLLRKLTAHSSTPTTIQHGRRDIGNRLFKCSF